MSKTRSCKVHNCSVPHYAKNYCKKHYTQVVRHGKLTPNRERVLREARICSVRGCENRHCAKGKCTRHYVQARNAKK